MTDKKTLTNQSIKLMWSKCDTDRDGYLDFEEFKEMLLRSRARKELERLEEEEELGTSELEILRLEEERTVAGYVQLYSQARLDTLDALDRITAFAPKKSLSARKSATRSMAIRSCDWVSRSRTVTAWSVSESPSTVKQ